MKDKKMKGVLQKPEYMTSLSGDTLVPKTHARIVFRGKVDSLEAEVIEAQVLASQLGEGDYCSKLGEILDYLRCVMAAEVKEAPLSPPFLFGMDAEEIHRQSHGLGASLPSYTQGPLAARLNTLRTRVREAELLAVKVFDPVGDETGAESGEGAGAESGDVTVVREDIILALNRLSSALWWLQCKCAAENVLEKGP